MSTILPNIKSKGSLAFRSPPPILLRADSSGLVLSTTKSTHGEFGSNSNASLNFEVHGDREYGYNFTGGRSSTKRDSAAVIEAGGSGISQND